MEYLKQVPTDTATKSTILLVKCLIESSEIDLISLIV